MNKKTIDRFLFVFDADSGRWNAFVDSTRKLFMLKGCALCSITHGMLGERSEWASCKEALGAPIEYLHRDQLSRSLEALVRDQLPCIIAVVEGNYIMLIPPRVLERCGGSINELKGKMNYYLARKDLEVKRESTQGRSQTEVFPLPQKRLAKFPF